jgi:DNA-binding transcriptional LysR family regulator
VTELTALTWLPRLIAAIQAEYPKVVVEAEVDLNATLREGLAADTIDIIVVPQINSIEPYAMTRVGEVENAWMCAPSLSPKKAAIPLAEIAQFPLILQGGFSGTGYIYTRFLQEHGIDMQRILASNSMIAPIGLTLSGLGVSYFAEGMSSPHGHTWSARYRADATGAAAPFAMSPCTGPISRTRSMSKSHDLPRSVAILVRTCLI